MDLQGANHSKIPMHLHCLMLPIWVIQSLPLYKALVCSERAKILTLRSTCSTTSPTFTLSFWSLLSFHIISSYHSYPIFLGYILHIFSILLWNTRDSRKVLLKLRHIGLRRRPVILPLSSRPGSWTKEASQRNLGFWEKQKKQDRHCSTFLAFPRFWCLFDRCNASKVWSEGGSLQGILKNLPKENAIDLLLHSVSSVFWCFWGAFCWCISAWAWVSTLNAPALSCKSWVALNLPIHLCRNVIELLEMPKCLLSHNNLFIGFDCISNQSCMSCLGLLLPPWTWHLSQTIL